MERDVVCHWVTTSPDLFERLTIPLGVLGELGGNSRGETAFLYHMHCVGRAAWPCDGSLWFFPLLVASICLVVSAKMPLYFEAKHLPQSTRLTIFTETTMFYCHSI